MSLAGVIAGSFAQMMLAVFLFMLVAVSGGSIANEGNLSKLSSAILNMSLYVLPGLAVGSAAIVVYCFCVGGTAAAYWWYAMPLVGVLLYLLYVFVFIA